MSNAASSSPSRSSGAGLRCSNETPPSASARRRARLRSERRRALSPPPGSVQRSSREASGSFRPAYGARTSRGEH
jgi:hypothetical protein